MPQFCPCIGRNKTNLLIEDFLLEHFKLDTSEVVYFEHNPAAVESAQSVGIKTYFFDNVTKDTPALKDFLDSNL